MQKFWFLIFFSVILIYNFFVMNLKRTFLILCAAAVLFDTAKAQTLKFDADNFTQKQLTMPDGFVVKYKAYENIFYVSNVEDSVYQTLNVYVPENLKQDSPIFLRTYIGGYLASKANNNKSVSL